MQLFDIILKISGFKENLILNAQKKREEVLNIIGLDSFLLIADNFETLQNPSDFLAFFEEIGDKCEETKIIITTRHQLGISEKVIDIQEFSRNEYYQFVSYLLNKKYKYSFELHNSYKEKLYQFTGGLPLATEFILSQLSNVEDIGRIIKKIENRNIDKDSILRIFL